MTFEELDRLREWVEVLDEANYYEILGVLELADTEGIRQAFREFASAFHPDALGEDSAEARALSTRIYRRGAEAYRVLCDPEQRRRYDLALARGLLRLCDADSDAPPKPGRAQSIEDVCHSPAARIHARRADTHISAGDYDAARRALREAIAAEEHENPELEERLDALDLVHFARGD